MNISPLDGIKTIYYTMLKDKRKDRFEMILEPLQAIIQLGLLSFCPVGTKMSISNNILFIQEPTWGQSLMRSYNHDCKDDLVYLFSVVTRFYKFYSYLNDSNEDNSNFYLLIIELAKNGIDKLSQTYSSSGHGSLLQSLKMYKTMFDKSNIYWDTNINEDKYNDDGIPRDNIDEIFIQIRELYEPSQFIIIHHLLKMMKKHPDEYVSYMKSINHAMVPVSNRIQKWIHSHIAY